MNAAPLSWLKEIQNTLIDTKAIPLSGYSPHFPWDEMSHKVALLLQAQDCKIRSSKTTFMNGSEITSGLGDSPVCIAFDLTPLSSHGYWIMGKEDVANLTTLALTSSPASKGLSSSKFQEGFYYYLATQAILAIDELKPFQDLALKMAKFTSLPQEEALCIDVEIAHPKQTFWGRVVCPTSFHQEFKNHFSNKQPPELTSAIAKQIDVTLRLELGHTTLSVRQWQNINIGDFILLDRCSFDPHTHKGTATLMLDQTPLFRTRIKESNLKIVDYALYHQEQTSMDPKTPEDHLHPEDQFESEYLSSSEIEEDTSLEEENHLWAPENEHVEKLVSRTEIPLTLSVEVARLQINLDKLLALSPGNILELPVKPQAGVDVVIEGKKVAKAELIKLGDMLGIKILSLGE